MLACVSIWRVRSNTGLSDECSRVALRRASQLPNRNEFSDVKLCEILPKPGQRVFAAGAIGALV